MTTLVLLPVAVIGFGVLILEVRGLWRERFERSRRAKRRRLRIGAWAFSFAGLALVLMVHFSGLPAWLADLGIGIVLGSWAVFGLATVVFAFLEGFEEGKSRGP